MTRGQGERYKRDMLIYKLHYVDGDSYVDIAQRLIARGYESMHPETIRKIARKIKLEIQAKKGTYGA
jgi:hypothetical protein